VGVLSRRLTRSAVPLRSAVLPGDATLGNPQHLAAGQPTANCCDHGYAAPRNATGDAARPRQPVKAPLNRAFGPYGADTPSNSHAAASALG
jgi:hypothetical protein